MSHGHQMSSDDLKYIVESTVAELEGATVATVLCLRCSQNQENSDKKGSLIKHRNGFLN